MIQDKETLHGKDALNESKTASNPLKINKAVLFRQRRLTIAFVAAFIIFTLTGISLYQSGRHLLTLKETHKQVEAEYNEIANQEKELSDEVLLLNDEEYVSKIVRSKYFYSKEGEQVYSIPDLNNN